MNEPRPSQQSLPQALEDAVLEILEGPDAERDVALRALLLAHPQHNATLRQWLLASGIAVPVSIGPAGPGQTVGDLDDELPFLLGPYLLLEKLGKGGFGTVFRAEQQEPIRRPVAIKILNLGMDSRDILARFAAEREALNRMDHPGIARLLDAGTTGHGRPFFVMELVAGPTLLAHCRKKHLPVRARIGLFLKVLDAMQHAHQKAMLHRDLSSNNVLVADPDGNPQPKVIDFGIAKSTSDPLLQGGALTLSGTLMGTPEFMSPEQAAGNANDLDTRADVYALGVQLYELLTDQLPIPGVVLRSQGLTGIAAIVRNFAPQQPSAIAPRERHAELRGDLDGIVMKAIAKSRDERYGSVGELAADLRAHLADQPVHVVAPSRWYRLRKFIRRNRAQSVAAAIAAAGLLAALAILWSAWRMARTSAEVAAEMQRVSDAKADAGFLLLANEERLAAAIAAEQALGPPWPEHEADYELWLRDHGRPLANERPKLQQRLAEISAAGATPATAPTDIPTLHLQRALTRLDAAIGAFLGTGGALPAVEQRLELLRATMAPAMTTQAPAWRIACADIRTSDGVRASRAYRGLSLSPLPGLVPLGPDAASLLHEFVDLASHEPGYPLPTRAAGGALQVGAGTGIVFVLVPAGRLDQGTSRDRPGVARNDEFAADDELAGTAVPLDAFLIARTELTLAQWWRLSGHESRRDPQLPVTNVDWPTARTVLVRHGLALPTEAQWEYACRANSRWPWSSGPTLVDAARCGQFSGVSLVAQLPPNAFGLFDLHGNVAEWCDDEKLPYEDVAPRKGDGRRERKGELVGEMLRVVRGGAWHDGPIAARTTARDSKPPATRADGLGVRAVRAIRRLP